MTVPLLSFATLLICAASTSADTKVRRSLLQQQQQQVIGASTSLYRPTTSGGLTLFSNLTVLSDGESSVVYPLNVSSTGSTVVLQQYSLRRTPVVQNAGCIQVGLTANSTRVRSFLTTYSSYLDMMQGNYFVLSTANAIAGSNLSSASRSPVLVSTDPTEQYVDLIFSLDLNPQLIQYRLSAYPPGAPECSAAAPSGGMTQPFSSMNVTTASAASAPRTAGSGRRLLQRSGAYSPASAPSPSTSQTQTAQLSKQDVLSDGSIVAPAAFTNASCIGYKLFGQDPDYARNHRIDVTVVVVDLPNMLSWAAQGFNFRPSNVSFRAACLQNSSHPGDCGAYIDQLDPGQIYYVLGITGIQQVRVISSDIIFDLYFTAQANGSCANNAVQSYSTGIDFELTDPYDYYDYEDRADGPAAPDTGMDNLAPYLVGDSAPGASPVSQSAQPPNGIVLYGSAQEGGQLFPLPGK